MSLSSHRKRGALPVLAPPKPTQVTDTSRLILLAYGLLAIASAGGGYLLRDLALLDYPAPWLALDVPTRWVASLSMGLVFAVLVIAATRAFVKRFQWAKALHTSFRPFARSLSTVEIVALALFSSAGEELLFRGLLTPWMGVPLAALVFGVVHQMPGKNRWVWASWAAIVGVGLGSIFASSGTIIGCIVAHALINGVNLQFVRDYDEDARRRPLDRPAFRRRLSTSIR